MAVNNIHSSVRISKLLNDREIHTNREIIEVLFEKPIPKKNYFYNNYLMWFENKYVPNPIMFNEQGEIIGVHTTVNTILDFLTVKKEYANYNQCLDQANEMGIYVDHEKWQKKS